MKLSIPEKLVNPSVLGIFLVGFLMFFIRFGVNGTMPGHTDGWFYISVFESFNHVFSSWFTGEQVGDTFYPMGPVYKYGDPCVLGALFYLPFRWLGLGPLWAWSLMLTVVYTFSAFGAFLFFKEYFKRNVLAFWGGLAFGTACFLWGNVDSPNAFYFGTLFLCLYYSLRFFESGSWVHMLLTVLWGAATLYFSSYIFVFQTILLAIFWAFRAKQLLRIDGIVVKLGLAVLLATGLVLPYLYFIANPDGMLNMWNPVREYQVLRALSLDINDLVRPLYGNLLYPMLQDHLTAHAFFYPQHAAWTGIFLWLLAALGAVIAFRRGLVWLVVFGVGLIIAIGPELRIGSTFVPMPMMVFYKVFGLDMAIRNPVRFWYLCIIGLIGLSTYGIEWLMARYKHGFRLVAFVCLIYLLENVPFQIRQYDAEQYMHPDETYLNILKAQKGAVVMELPSSVYTYDIDFPYALNEYQREHIYQYWQTLHRQYILNGSNAFLPPSRLKVKALVDELTAADNLQTLINDFKIDFVVFHKDLPLPQDNPGLQRFLLESEVLTLLEETETTTIYSTTQHD